jgi:hypothetical protein
MAREGITAIRRGLDETKRAMHAVLSALKSVQDWDIVTAECIAVQLDGRRLAIGQVQPNHSWYSTAPVRLLPCLMPVSSLGPRARFLDTAHRTAAAV